MILGLVQAGVAAGVARKRVEPVLGEVVPRFDVRFVIGVATGVVPPSPERDHSVDARHGHLNQSAGRSL